MGVENQTGSTNLEFAAGLGSSGLESDVRLSANLKNFWYPIEFSANLREDQLVPLELFDVPWVVFRDKDGK
jgi:hypothetical protein